MTRKSVDQFAVEYALLEKETFAAPDKPDAMNQLWNIRECIYQRVGERRGDEAIERARMVVKAVGL